MGKSQIARIGDYVIERRLGAGGMGVVYLAKQIAMHRHVALKVLRENLLTDQSYIDRFFHEVRLLSGLEHISLVRVYEGGQDGSNLFFSMEFVEGDDLKYAIDRRRKFSEREAADIAVQVAAALDYAWKKGKMIHRDIKPANIILRKDGTAKILDFGISKKVTPDNTVCVTNTGIMIGSPTYMSPEQAGMENDIDFRADIYSLGITLYHLLTGQVPYDGNSAVAVITQHVSAPIPNVRSLRPEISRRMAKMIRKMMAKDKADRYGSWEELRLDMLKVRAETKKQHIQISRQWLYCAAGFFAAVLLCLTLFFGAGLFRSGTQTEKNTAPPAQTVPQIRPAEQAALDVQIADGIREYRRLQTAYRTVLQKKNDEFLLKSDYRNALRYFQTQPDLPAEFQENGKYRKIFLSDTVMQEWIEVHLQHFEKEIADMSQILRHAENVQE